jgi:hypothetical protein
MPRIGNPARLFFRPIETFLVDHATAHKLQARILRRSLEPIWTWISRDLVPAEGKTFSDAIEGALAGNDFASCERLTCDFQDRVAGRIEQVLAAAASAEMAPRRLAGQLGSARTLDDVRDLHDVLKARDTLALIGDRLPRQVRNLADADVDGVKAVLDAPAVRAGGILPYALVLVMGRLAAPWQLIRLAIKAARSDDAARIAMTPYADAVAIVLGEMERTAAELEAELIYQARRRHPGDLAAQGHP